MQEIEVGRIGEASFEFQFVRPVLVWSWTVWDLGSLYRQTGRDRARKIGRGLEVGRLAGWQYGAK